MKKQKLLSFDCRQKSGILVCMFSLLILASCSQSQPENQYLGKIPGEAQKHNQEAEKLLVADAEATDFEKKAEIRERISGHSKEWSEWLQEYAGTGGIQPIIPHEVDGEFPYTLNEVNLEVKRSVVDVQFLLTTKEPFRIQIPKQRIKLYFVGIDSNNNPIVFSALPAGMYTVNEALPAGAEISINGTWNKDHLMFLEDLTGIRIISEELYRELDREKVNIMSNL